MGFAYNDPQQFSYKKKGGGGVPGQVRTPPVRGTCLMGYGAGLFKKGTCLMGYGAGLFKKGTCLMGYVAGLFRKGTCLMGYGSDLFRKRYIV